ncbi:MAG TPA: GrpB family protein [Schlesneria sp.]|jgi:GrpB-like predicted nucleotidyltransferase (UPF0157 family)
MIVIIPYQSDWPERFNGYGQLLRRALGPLALRIDHIGSTSVLGLAAKDVIDIQVSVSELIPEVEQALNEAGYARLQRITRDHLPPGMVDEPDQWAKWFFTEPVEIRRMNLHVRVEGRANQRYPILFRDYLRANPTAAAAYGQVKIALATRHAEDADAYYDIKDPVCDIIMAGAENWAEATKWEPCASDR